MGGLRAAPLVLLLLLLPETPATPAPTESPCSTLVPDASEELNLTGRSWGCDELDWSLFHQQRRLTLRRNGIEALSPGSRLGPRMQELDLAENRLWELPEEFFTNATALQTLQLEGNPLPAVPAAAFQPSLRLLSVSCRCDVVGTVLAPCARSETHCLCYTSHGKSSSVEEFHSGECGLRAGLVAGVAAAVAVAVLVAAGVAVVWYRRRRAAAAVAGVGWGKQDPAGAPRQPRYISRDTGTGAADVADAPDYENIFVSPGTAPAAERGCAPGWQEQRYSPQLPVDEDYFLESAADPGDQPIYANTLGPTEDVYIVPDQ